MYYGIALENKVSIEIIFSLIHKRVSSDITRRCLIGDTTLLILLRPDTETKLHANDSIRVKRCCKISVNYS